MDVFMKNRFARWTVIILVVLNIATLTMLWLQRSHRRPGGPPGPHESREQSLQFLKEELELSDHQFNEYRRLQEAHHQNSEQLHRQMLELRQRMMEELFKPEPDSTQALEYAEHIGRLQVEMDKLTFSHFQELQQLLGVEQKEKLRTLLNDFFHRNRPGTPPGRRHRPPPGHGDPRHGGTHRPPPPRH